MTETEKLAIEAIDKLYKNNGEDLKKLSEIEKNKKYKETLEIVEKAIMEHSQTHEYNQNLVFTNEETHEALVSHFNQIEEFAKNKKFEWEDEELTETYGITYDFDKWLNQLEIDIKRDYYERINREVPENFRNNLMNYANQLKNYVDGFLLTQVGMYKGKSIKTEMFIENTFDEIVEHIKQVEQNNKMVFLDQVFDRIKRPKEFVIDGIVFPQDLSTQYVVLYGVLNE